MQKEKKYSKNQNCCLGFRLVSVFLHANHRWSCINHNWRHLVWEFNIHRKLLYSICFLRIYRIGKLRKLSLEKEDQQPIQSIQLKPFIIQNPISTLPVLYLGKQTMLPVFHYFIGLIKYYNIFYCDSMHQPTHQRTPRHQPTHPQRKPFTMPPSPTQKCGSRTPSSSAKKNKKAKNDPSLNCWVGLLADIERVTGKVERLCLDANRVQTCRLKAQSKNIQKKLTDNKDLAPLSAHMRPQPHHQPQDKQPHEQPQAQPQPKNCNPDCHYLMYECMKLNSANQKLQQEKEHLEKRLYYESKEKRELRWKLEKDHDRQRDRDTDDMLANLTNYFTMHYSDSHANSAQSSHSITVHPPVHPAPGPLKQKNPNTPSMGNSLPSCPQRAPIQKQNVVPLPEQQSLLIELTSGREEREKEGKYGKSLELRRAHFEAHLQDLLELCRNEHDQGRKRTIREQMRKVVDQLQTLKPE